MKKSWIIYQIDLNESITLTHIKFPNPGTICSETKLAISSTEFCQCKLDEREIVIFSMFDRTRDLNPARQRYGDGNYILHNVHEFQSPWSGHFESSAVTIALTTMAEYLLSYCPNK